MRGKGLIGLIIGVFALMFGILFKKTDDIQKEMEYFEWTQEVPSRRKYLESRNRD